MIATMRDRIPITIPTISAVPSGLRCSLSSPFGVLGALGALVIVVAIVIVGR